MKISMIVAMGQNRAIGFKNQLIWRLKSDLAHFKKGTMEKAILMGRKTYESIGRPLPGRRMIVLTRNTQFAAKGIEVIHSIEELKALNLDELVVIGGEQIYKLMLPFTQTLHLTRVEVSPEADAFFPALGEGWTLLSKASFKADEFNEYDFELIELESKSGCF